MTKGRRDIWGSEELKRWHYCNFVVLWTPNFSSPFCGCFWWWWHFLVYRGQVGCLAWWSTSCSCLITSSWLNSDYLFSGRSLVNAVYVPAQPTQRPRSSSLPNALLTFGAGGHSDLSWEDTCFSICGGTLRMYEDPLSLKSVCLQFYHLSVIPAVFLYWKALFYHSCVCVFAGIVLWKRIFPPHSIVLKCLFWQSLWTGEWFSFSALIHLRRDWFGGSGYKVM